MTTVAVMQPYLFPYIGYYQMAAMADHFVFLDDANFIVRGFVNRNQMLMNGKAHRFTEPVTDASQNRAIKSHRYPDRGKTLLKLLKDAYRSAPRSQPALQLIEQVFEEGDGNVAATNASSIQRALEYAGLQRRWHRSSDILPQGQFKGSRWIIEICHRLNASRYLNLPGGRSLYESADFENAGIALQFVEPVFTTYHQISPFVRGLSMIDILMWCEPAELLAMLQAGRTTPPSP
jgi:hypothetical protein